MKVESVTQGYRLTQSHVRADTKPARNTKFTKESGQELDFGTDNYAFQAFLDGDSIIGIIISEAQNEVTDFQNERHKYNGTVTLVK